jgi:hypothetical protein
MCYAFLKQISRCFKSATNQPTFQKIKLKLMWVWVNTYRYILVGWTSIYQLFWGSLGTRGLTHPHVAL